MSADDLRTLIRTDVLADEPPFAMSGSRWREPGGRIAAQAARLAHREQRDRGERHAQQQAAQREARDGRPDHRQQHAQRLQRASGRQQQPVVPMRGQARTDDRAGHDG